MIEQSADELSSECATVASELAQAKVESEQSDRFAEGFTRGGEDVVCTSARDFRDAALARAKTLRAVAIRDDGHRVVEMLEKRLAHLQDELVTVLKAEAQHAIELAQSEDGTPQRPGAAAS